MKQVKNTWGKVADFSRIPNKETEEHRLWLEHKDTIPYLIETSTGFSPIYISGNGFFAYSILVPNEALKDNYVDELLAWDFMVSSGWGYGHDYINGIRRKRIYPPMDGTGTKTLENKTPIIYYRDFFGYPDGQETYLQLDQQIAHILDIHWVEKHSAYCKLDHLGDIKPVIQTSVTNEGSLALADLQELDFYLYLTDTSIVRVFDVMKFQGLSWDGKKDLIQITRGNTELHANLMITQNTQSYLRGFQIIRRTSSNSRMERILEGKDPNPKKYATVVTL